MEIRIKGNVLILISGICKGYTFGAFGNYHLTIKVVVLLEYTMEMRN